MDHFPFRIAGISSRIGQLVPLPEWAERVRVPNHKAPGQTLSGAEMQKILGIESKSWDPELFADFNVICRTAMRAMESAAVSPDQIDLAMVVSCTPYEIMLDQDAFRLWRMLGLRDDTVPVVLGAGCAGLARAASLAARSLARRVLVVTYNVPSLFMMVENGEANPAYLHNEIHPMHDSLWASPAIFSDGCAAVVLERSKERETVVTYSRDARAFGDGPGFFGPLVTFEGGGALHPPGSTLQRELSCYAMHSSDIREYYLQGMLLNHAALQRQRPRYLDECARLYVHQASPRLIDGFIAAAEISREKVPSQVVRYGNLVSSSTLRLLHEDLVGKRISAGDEIALSVVGAGPERGAFLCHVAVKHPPPLE